MINILENREIRRGFLVIGALLGAICVLLVFQFTRRSPEAVERERAQVMLRRICDLQFAHFSETGTYLPIDREKNGDILLLNNAPGRFRYRVVVTESGFEAFAEADLNGDGRMEIWRADSADPEPVRVQEE